MEGWFLSRQMERALRTRKSVCNDELPFMDWVANEITLKSMDLCRSWEKWLLDFLRSLSGLSSAQTLANRITISPRAIKEPDIRHEPKISEDFDLMGGCAAGPFEWSGRFGKCIQKKWINPRAWQQRKGKINSSQGVRWANLRKLKQIKT